MQLVKLITAIVLSAAAVTSQTTGNSTGSGSGNSTSSNSSSSIYEMISQNNKTLGTSKFVALLKSDPGYQPIIETLSKSGNLTTFIPNDKAVDTFLNYWKTWTSKNHTKTGTYPAANATYQNYTAADLIMYHVVGENFTLHNTTNSTRVYNTLLNDTNVSPNGYGLPLLVTNNATWSQFNNQTWMKNQSQYLSYMVGNGNMSTKVQHKDVAASNGEINIIDSVLAPPMNLTTLLNSNNNTMSLSKLIKKYPDVVKTLGDIKNYTLFAPNDTALHSLNLKSASNDTIKALILNHCVQGVYYSTNITEAAGQNNGNLTLTTLGNTTLPVFFNMTSGNITLNDTAKVVEPNLLTNAGVVHIIDHVLVPPTSNSSSTNSSTGSSTASSSMGSSSTAMSSSTATM